jgi:hypothetical protein
VSECRIEADGPKGSADAERRIDEVRVPATDSDVRVYLDPTSERATITRTLAERPASLEGKVIGLLDIIKPRGDVFLDRLETLLTERGLRTMRFRKPTFTKVAPVDLRHEIATKCDVIVEALAD